MYDFATCRRCKKRALAMMCFLTRLYHYNDDILNEVAEEVDLAHVHKTFYKSFEKAFCKEEGKVHVHAMTNFNDIARGIPSL